MGDGPHQFSVLHERRAAHPLHDAAGGVQQGRVGDAQRQVAILSAAHPFNAHCVVLHRAAGEGRPELSVAGVDFFRAGNGQHRSGVLRGGGVAAVQAGGVVSGDGADNVRQKFSAQLPGCPGGRFAHAGHGDGHDLAGKQREIGPGIHVGDRVPQPRKAARYGVHKGQCADACAGVPHPQPGLVHPRSIRPGGQLGRVLMPAAPVEDRHSAALPRLQGGA